MNLQMIERLAHGIGYGTLESLELEMGGKRLVLRRAAQAQSMAGVIAETTAPPVPGRGEDFIRAPASGVFHAHHPLADKAFALARPTVAAGEAIGYLQVGAVLSPVHAGEPGVLGEVITASGTLVGYGQALFAFERAL